MSKRSNSSRLVCGCCNKHAKRYIHEFHNSRVALIFQGVVFVFELNLAPQMYFEVFFLNCCKVEGSLMVARMWLQPSDPSFI